MRVFNSVYKRFILILMSMLLIISTGGCGKKSDIKKNKVENQASKVEKFSTDFFYNCNLPYEKLQATDVQNTADEYLFYINNGVVYRTLNDCAVVIVDRSEIRETAEQAASNYSGEIYKIFEDSDVDVLKYSACGDYAIMASLNTIPNWSESEIITAFMEYAADYK